MTRKPCLFPLWHLSQFIIHLRGLQSHTSHTLLRLKGQLGNSGHSLLRDRLQALVLDCQGPKLDCTTYLMTLGKSLIIPVVLLNVFSC